jgi:hypothetical protein
MREKQMDRHQAAAGTPRQAADAGMVGRFCLTFSMALVSFVL